jgi:hypothetical protein
MVTPVTMPNGLAVERWPGELLLFAVCVALSALIWGLLIMSQVGLVYALQILTFVLLAQALAVGHVRANGVRVAPDQFPEIFAAVTRISRQLGLDNAPETYVVQQGGVLNALARRFIGSNILVLNAELLDACADSDATRDMFLGREIGRICAGHLRWEWFIFPSRLVPFFGQALARARQYTSDRYGLAAAGNLENALNALSILAAGGSGAARLNRHALARQARDLDGFWMSAGQVYASHPPLSRRMAALDETRAIPFLSLESRG